jgi:hypothetical protein
MVAMPTYEPGDYIKIELPDEATGIPEWLWVRVEACDYERQLVFGRLDNQPVGNYEGKLRLGSELAVHFAQIRDHKKYGELTSKM